LNTLNLLLHEKGVWGWHEEKVGRRDRGEGAWEQRVRRTDSGREEQGEVKTEGNEGMLEAVREGKGLIWGLGFREV
jgi:hypothetical protein